MQLLFMNPKLLPPCIHSLTDSFIHHPSIPRSLIEIESLGVGYGKTLTDVLILKGLGTR